MGLADEDDIRARLAQKQEEHRDLDAVVARLLETPVVDQLQLTRLKKRKLVLKDEIAKLEAMLIPDIIA
ncbi:MAG: YdcH family protein [Bdellovibrionales bacterium]